MSTLNSRAILGLNTERRKFSYYVFSFTLDVKLVVNKKVDDQGLFFNIVRS